MARGDFHERTWNKRHGDDDEGALGGDTHLPILPAVCINIYCVTAQSSMPDRQAGRQTFSHLAILHNSSMPDRSQEDTRGRRVMQGRESQGNLAGPVELRCKGLEPARKTHSDRDASHIAKHRCQPSRCQIHRAELRRSVPVTCPSQSRRIPALPRPFPPPPQAQRKQGRRQKARVLSAWQVLYRSDKRHCHDRRKVEHHHCGHHRPRVCEELI